MESKSSEIRAGTATLLVALFHLGCPSASGTDKLELRNWIIVSNSFEQSDCEFSVIEIHVSRIEKTFTQGKIHLADVFDAFKVASGVSIVSQHDYEVPAVSEEGSFADFGRKNAAFILLREIERKLYQQTGKEACLIPLGIVNRGKDSARIPEIVAAGAILATPLEEDRSIASMKYLIDKVSAKYSRKEKESPAEKNDVEDMMGRWKEFLKAGGHRNISIEWFGKIGVLLIQSTPPARLDLNNNPLSYSLFDEIEGTLMLDDLE